MMNSLDEILTSDASFRTTGDLDMEIDSDTAVHILLPAESMPYFRDAGTPFKSNMQKIIRFSDEILAQAQAVRSVALMSDLSTSSSKERRVVLGPQTGITILSADETQNGEAAVEIRYFPLKDIGKTPRTRTL